MPEYVSWPNQFPFSAELPFAYKEGRLFSRQCFAPEGLFDFPVNLLTHVLIVLYRGDILVDSPRGLNIVPEGNIVLLPAGLYRFTEAPSPSGMLDYVILFFRPGLLIHGIVPMDNYEHIARFIPFEQHPNTYQLKSMTNLIPKEELVRVLGKLPDFMNALSINGGVWLFAFLKHHFFWQRRWIDDLLKREDEISPEHLLLLRRLRREYFGPSAPRPQVNIETLLGK